MRTNRTGYLMAMLAGLAIVGASTGGVVAATSHHNDTLAADASASAAAQSSTAAASSAASSSTTSGSTASSSAASSSATSSSAESSSAEVAPSSAAASSAPRATTARTPASRTPASTTTAPKTTAPPTTSKPSTSAPTTSKPSISTSTAAAASQFKDGTYSATGSYNSPGGTEKLGVTLTIASDKVTKSELDLLGGAGLSHSFQAAFAAGYSDLVIGKDISGITLGAVSGSSLTGMGFNDALKQIESQARSQQ
ncbi:hypothetical protein ABIB25_004546 [Nakamurella sp. UYEF19]|uniref:hypothetical protein n=1 Tax=Nakamurella sp. UYEF19 TaxID=1756392 RepID=UPI0033959850